MRGKHHFRDTEWKGKTWGSVKPEKVQPSTHLALISNIQFEVYISFRSYNKEQVSRPPWPQRYNTQPIALTLKSSCYWQSKNSIIKTLKQNIETKCHLFRVQGDKIPCLYSHAQGNNNGFRPTSSNGPCIHHWMQNKCSKQFSKNKTLI